ncbi:putative phage anti-repressor protein [Campylobacter coli]|nr:helix-turn-helix transcriptional regulator [Campylobacter coli]SUW71104.1 putative phage anti-repressor protein [Campylobacter coli]SUW79981.1 putative phage anti-repressor protein [Campylobacter coli]
MQNITSNLIFTNEQVASNYGLTTGLTIAKHLRTHNDEFIENTHYFLVENSFKNKTIKWTLEGVYKLFDKIKKLKERNKMAEEKENIVKKVCKELNITQRQLSEMLEIPESTIARWKSGDLPRLTELFLKTMLENIELKRKLETIKKAHKIISEL